MKIWILSDTHFGKYSLDSDKWLNNMKSYFYGFFIPKLKKHAKQDDKFFFLGDLFDNRNSIDMRALTAVVDIFEELSKIIDCHVLLGNHDQRMMTNPDINSVCTIRNIPNVKIYNTVEQIKLDGLDIVMMPWVHGKDNEKEILEKYTGADLLFCHSDLNGCRTQLYPTRPQSKTILDIEDFEGFGKIYSGHIHIVQTINNFTFVGSPYHLDRNDVQNRKGIFVYDTKKKSDIFIENDFSPEFVKCKLYSRKDFDKLEEVLKTDNFIDVELSNNLLLNNPDLRLKFDKLCNKYKILNIDFINDIVEDEAVEKNIPKHDLKKLSIKDISFDWVDDLKISQDTDLFEEMDLKQNMKETIDKCFDMLNQNKK